MNLDENNGLAEGAVAETPPGTVPAAAPAEASVQREDPPAEPVLEKASEALTSVSADEGEGAAPGSDEAQSPPEPPPAPAEPSDDAFLRLRKHHVAPAMIKLDRIDDDRTFQIRPEGDISQLATDIARLGQLFPIDIRLKPPDRFQVICGFRRVAALRFLQRDRVLARLHTDLSDDDALLMALVSAIHARPVTTEELDAIRGRLEAEGRLTPSIRSMLDKAVSPEDDLAPETVGEEAEIDADELAQDVTLRLGEINQDLSLLADVFDSLDRERQESLLEQLRYSSDLVAYLEGRR